MRYPMFAFSVFLVFSIATSAQAFVSVDLEDIDRRDIDVLVGNFSSLVAAFQKFAIDENSILEQRINQVFDRFDQSMSCAIDQMTAKGENTLGRTMDDFNFFRSEEVEYCQSNVILRPFGGVLDRARLEQCVVRRLLTQKEVPFEAVSSAYSGLKEFANAAFCNARGKEGTAEYDHSKDYFSQASIMAEVYDDISELPGCDQSSPEKLYECTDRYYVTSINNLKNAFHLDQRSVDYESLEKMRRAMSRPEKETRLFFNDETVLTVDQLDDYEALSAELRRNLDLVALNRARRQQAYEQKVVASITQINKQNTILKRRYQDLYSEYATCEFVRGKYSTFFPSRVLAPLKKNTQTCKEAIDSNNFSDLVSINQIQRCKEYATTLISEAESYVRKMKKDCDETIDNNHRMMEQRQLRMGTY